MGPGMCWAVGTLRAQQPHVQPPIPLPPAQTGSVAPRTPALSPSTHLQHIRSQGGGPAAHPRVLRMDQGCQADPTKGQGWRVSLEPRCGGSCCRGCHPPASTLPKSIWWVIEMLRLRLAANCM